MTWKINCKEKITSEYILYLYHLLKKYMPERYSNAKLVLMQAKAKQFTNAYSLEKNLEEFLEYLTITDSDLKIIKRV